MSTFTIRTEESEDKAIENFMDASGFKTKNKAILALILDAERLYQNDKILCEIVKAEENLKEAKRLLQDVKSPNLNRYHF